MREKTNSGLFVQSIKRLWSKSDKYLLSILFLALVIRVALAIPVFVDMSRTQACYDAVSYDLLARHTLEGKGFSVSFEAPYEPNSTITPGYPLFLSAVYIFAGYSRLAVILIQIIINLALLVVIYSFIKDRFGVKAAFWGGLFFTLDINMVIFLSQLTTETLFTMVLVALLLLLIRFVEDKRIVTSIWSGVLLGLATLIRPIALYFSVPILAFFFLTKINWQKLAGWVIILVVQIACITPWVIRNKAVFGEAFYTTISDVNLLQYQVAPLKAALEHKSRTQAQKELKDEALSGKSWKNKAQYYRLWSHPSKRYIISHPIPYIGTLILGGVVTLIYPLPMSETGIYFRGKKNLPAPGIEHNVMLELMKGRFWNAIRIAWRERLSYFGAALFSLFILYSIFHMVKLAFGLKAYIIKGMRDPAMLLFLITGLYFLGLLGFGISPRMRVPLEPLLAALAGIGVASRRIKKVKTDSKQHGDSIAG